TRRKKKRKRAVNSSNVTLRHVWRCKTRVKGVAKLSLICSSNFSLLLVKREKKQKVDKSGGRKVMDEIRSFEKANLFDLGHPRINRIADSFGQGSMGPPSENAGSKKHRFPNLRGWLTICSILMHVTCCEVILLLDFSNLASPI
ncbi:hypothetical protein HID58_080343, partial [Brassica napus]